MFWTKVVEKIKTHILCSVTFSKNRTVYEIMSKNTVETEGPQMTSQSGAYALRAVFVMVYARMRMHMPTRPDTHTHARTDQYIMLIAFRRQQ